MQGETMTPEERASEVILEAIAAMNGTVDAFEPGADIIAEAIRDAVAEEREACAKMAENYGSSIEAEKAGSLIHERAAARIASSIRSRANEREKTG